jgi:murein DD-endopeptidase MepM/ murein hydrolase activator NlpD
MTSPGITARRRWTARIGAIALVLGAVLMPVVPASTTARAAPTVSAAPVAVVGASPPESKSQVLLHLMGVRPLVFDGLIGHLSTDGPARGAVVLARWSWPVGPPHNLLRSFEAPATPYGAGHRGIDIGAATGSPVRAPADGVVSFASTVVDRPVLSIQHADGLISSIEPVTAAVSAGATVSAGQVVGVVATGAHCSGRCVHFGVRRHGQYLSPLLVLGGVARAVLLPVPAGTNRG